MQTHLRVAVHPYPDRDALGDLERRVLAALDPPLNLEGMPRTVLRQRLSALRRHLIDAHEWPGRSGTRPVSRDIAPTAESVPRVTLHEEIATVLRESGRPMTTAEVADAVNERGIYSKRDKSLVASFQIHSRTRNYPRLFDRDGQIVRLRS
jgi:HB1, ASXL, restriction endonuclease HTH domain